MDMNCDIFKTNHAYSIQINSMMNDFGLISTFQHMAGFDHNVEFTRYDVKKNLYTLIDGILISSSLSSCVESCSIVHPPTNVSDHLPIAHSAVDMAGAAKSSKPHLFQLTL